MKHCCYLLVFLGALPLSTRAFKPDDITPVDNYLKPNCEDDYEEDNYDDDYKSKDDSESGMDEFEIDSFF